MPRGGSPPEPSRSRDGSIALLERLGRWAVPGALVMGVAWCVGGVISLALLGGGYFVDPADPEPLGWYLLEAAHVIGEAGLLAALVGVHARQGSRAGRLGDVGFWASFVGTALVLIGTVGNMVDPEGEVVGLVFLLGLLGWLVGFPLLGVATLRSKALPWWFGWGLIAFVPVMIFGLHFVLEVPGIGGLVVGGLWLALAYGLWSSRGPVERSSNDEEAVAE